jgi:hypothetical protein
LHFRERADRDVAGVISQKNIFPDWKVENWHVYPDPRARFASPHNPDHPPYPPDDYAAWLLSPNPQKPHKKYGVGRFEGSGYLDIIAAWDAQNRAEDEAAERAEQRERRQDKKEQKPEQALESPIKPAGFVQAQDPPAAVPLAPPRPVPGDEPLPADLDAFTALTGALATGYITALQTEQRPFRIRLEQAIELGIFNSREFQDRREDLYLAALPVTLERFGFAAQAFAASTIIRQYAGRDLADAGNRWRIDTNTGVTRLFPTGGELLFRFANQIVVHLGNGRPDIAVSDMTLTFIQPLLRGGGYAITLEALTQAERTLLYAIRSYARFRKMFYVAIAGLGDYSNNPYGLQGLAPILGRGIGAGLVAPRAGYLPTILQAAVLANQRKNITALEDFVRLFQNLKEGGGVTELQVVQVELQLLGSRAQYLTATRQYLDQLDNFKLQLGVPTTLPLELDDTPLRPMREQLQRFEQVYEDLAELQDLAGQQIPGETPIQLRQRWQRLLTESSLVKGTPLSKEYEERIGELNRLTNDELARVISEQSAIREKLLDARAERQLAGIEETPATLRELEQVEAAIDLARFEQSLRLYETQPWLRVPPERQDAEQANIFRIVADAGLLVAIRARNQRLDMIRDDWPDLPPICLDGVDLLKVPLEVGYTKVGQFALTNRFDLMNARAQVVDSYRQIAVQANLLQGILDVRYDLNTSTPAGGSQPFSFAGSRTRHAVALRAEPPFVRRFERNLYRASLISFQRQRRLLMAFEDNILADVRGDLRELRALAETYRLAKRSIELAYAQVDNARSTLLAPPDPLAARGAAGEAAALTQQLLNAQNRLLGAQNDLYAVWINYQTARMTLSLNLELLPLDARGIWNDEPLRCCEPVPDSRTPGPEPSADPDGAERPPARLPDPTPLDPGR